VSSKSQASAPALDARQCIMTRYCCSFFSDGLSPLLSSAFRFLPIGLTRPSLSSSEPSRSDNADGVLVVSEFYLGDRFSISVFVPEQTAALDSESLAASMGFLWVFCQPSDSVNA